MKIIISLFFIFLNHKALCLEIIRDPIFENYFKNLQIDYKIKENDVFLVKSSTLNAFVIENTIYFTTGIIENIQHEEVLKSIYFHEAGHVFHNHYKSKKIQINSNKKNIFFNNLFSIGAAIFTGNPSIGIATSLSLDQSLLNKLSTNSINFEIQADDYMLNMIEKNNISTIQLINFFNKLPDVENDFFKSHPTHKDRIISLKRFANNREVENSKIFEWIKAKYNKNSSISKFNDFFIELDKGKINRDNLDNLININLIDYEVYKSGLPIKNISLTYTNLFKINSSPYLKIEFFNYVIDKDQKEHFDLIEKYKNNKNIQNEYFFYFLYGKYYNRLGNLNLSNFYFCQFFKMIKFVDKSNYYCKKYDKKIIPEIDMSYALFK